MRILMISNLYPPFHRGGYELGCSDIANRLRARGHNVSILTSTPGAHGATLGDGVYRRLLLTPESAGASRLGFRLRLLQQQVINRAVTERTLREVRPDVIYLGDQYL